jgi:hypothetical protein
MSIASLVCWSMKTAVRRIVEAIAGRDSGHVQSHLAEEATRSRRDAGSTWLAHQVRQPDGKDAKIKAPARPLLGRDTAMRVSKTGESILKKCSGCLATAAANVVAKQRELGCHI